MPLKATLPSDFEARLTGLGDAIAASCPGVLFVYVFGSAATGTRTPRSDVDLAVFAAPGVDAHGTQLAVARAAARQLGTDAIDVVLLNTVPISVAGRVLGTRQVLVDREPHTRHRYESSTARLFHDFRIRERRLLASGLRMVDRDLILRRLANLDIYLEQLTPYRDIEVQAYRQDWKTQRIVERTLHLAIETCMDVADHVVADRRLRVPETGAESFEILAEAGVLAQKLGESLALMVGFRNILVHDYTRLDPTIVIRVLRTELTDLERFRDAIRAAV